MLPALIAWQRENGYPLQFSTEASVNLADEPELMELMVQANFRQVFIGIEITARGVAERNAQVSKHPR